MSKVILIDGGVMCHKAIFSWNQAKERSLKDSSIWVPPSQYTYFSMILSALKKIGVDKGDTIIIALEGHSWRKDYSQEYKAQRAGKRKEYELIDWDYHYNQINKINKKLDESTDWHFLQFKSFAEADDIMAVACKVFSDKECIVVTIDTDLFQLAYYENTKLFTLTRKCKGSAGSYVKVDNPLQIIADKAKKGDKSDNILVSENDTEEDFNLRMVLVNLLELPDFVEDPIKTALLNLQKKEIDFSKLPFQNSLAKKFPQIYSKDKVVTYDYCVQLLEKRKNKQKKKARERYRKKKQGAVI